jgi:chorismate--pyruvate lyase
MIPQYNGALLITGIRTLRPLLTCSTPRWRPIARLTTATVPAPWLHWLADDGSLTQRLIQASAGDFGVELLRQRVALPRHDEANALGLAQGRHALVREVVLKGLDLPWVYARSILPLATLTGRLRALRHLDNRPLGALLFADKSMARGDIEIAAIDPRSLPLRLGGQAPLWGRRSLFYLDGKPLLVSEIFLPGFNSYNIR